MWECVVVRGVCGIKVYVGVVMVVGCGGGSKGVRVKVW